MKTITTSFSAIAALRNGVPEIRNLSGRLENPDVASALQVAADETLRL